MAQNTLSSGTPHTWSFFRAGGFDQVKIQTGQDIASIDQLDQKLWAALSCPTRGLEFDNKTLDVIDTDKDGRIRAPEIIAACKWACAMLKDPDQLVQESQALPLAAINDDNPEGQQILASARQILANLGKPDSAAIDIDDTTDTVRIFAQTRFNGDGIIPVDSADDDFTKSVIADIIAVHGSLIDRSGKPGIDKVTLDLFFVQLQAYADWYAQSESDAAVHPLGQATPAAFAAYAAVAAKIDDYFARCRLAAYDSRALAALNRQECEYLAIFARDLAITADEVVGFPLARIGADKPLHLAVAINPAWLERIATFLTAVVTPILGDKTELSESDWLAIKARFAAYAAWQAAKPAVQVEKLGVPRIREILAGAPQPAIDLLIIQDKALEPEANAIVIVDKLVRYNRDLYRLLVNFVNFSSFYTQKHLAVFQVGRLYLDQRSCDLCIHVNDMATHAAMAPLSRAYIAYCDCTRRGDVILEKRVIAVAFTSGDSDNLMVGRNGVFYDRKGRDWDATIVKIIESPISIREAFWSPYKRVIRWIEEQIAKRAAAADTAASTAVRQSFEHAADTAAGAAAKPKPKLDIGTIAALGVAVGGISTAFGYLLQSFFNLGPAMPVGVIGLILLISGPSMVIAWLKLRQRNLAPLLDANGWAVNTRARINIPFGTSLTAIPKLPPGSRRDLFDPYAESRKGRVWTVVAIAMIGVVWGVWYFGGLERMCPDVFPESSYMERIKKKMPVQPATQPTTAPVPVVIAPK